MKRSALTILLILLFCTTITGCTGDTPALSTDEVNIITVENAETDLSALGKALENTDGIMISIEGASAADILAALASLGEINADNLSLELQLTGDADWTQLSTLASVHGLTTLILTGENTLSDLSPLNDLPYLTTLQLVDQNNVNDYTPLFANKTLDTLYIKAKQYDYKSLLTLPIIELQLPVEDNNWVALDQIKQNPYLKTINNNDVGLYSPTESLGDDAEKCYYYKMFDSVRLLTEKATLMNAGAIDKVVDAATLRTASIILAAPVGILQDPPYSDQYLLKTACGLEESDEENAIYFPYLDDYDTTADNSLLHYGSLETMDSRFLTAISLDEAASIIVYCFAVDADTGAAVNAFPYDGNCNILVRILDLQNDLFYTAAKVTSFPANAGDAYYYQNEILYNLNVYLSSLAVEGEIE